MEPESIYTDRTYCFCEKKSLILAESQMQVKGGKSFEVCLFPAYLINDLTNKNDWGTEMFLQEL